MSRTQTQQRHNRTLPCNNRIFLLTLSRFVTDFPLNRVFFYFSFDKGHPLVTNGLFLLLLYRTPTSDAIGLAKHRNIPERHFLTPIWLVPALSSPSPQGSQHGQPAAGSMSTPVPGTVGGGIRRGRWREWRRGDPTLLNNLWRSKTPLGESAAETRGIVLLQLKK